MHLRLNNLLEEVYKKHETDPKIFEGPSKANFFLETWLKQLHIMKHQILLWIPMTIDQIFR